MQLVEFLPNTPKVLTNFCLCWVLKHFSGYVGNGDLTPGKLVGTGQLTSGVQVA